MLMKKFLLSLAVMALGASVASATEYTLYDATDANKPAWDANSVTSGFKKSLSVNGKSFTLTTDKGSSTTNLRDPGIESYSMRVYKGSSLSIESSDLTIKSILIKFDDTSNNQYVKECDLSDGWTGKLTGVNYLLSSANGSTSITLTAKNAQVRIVSIVVSDTEMSAPVNPDPVDPTPSESVSVKNVKEAIAQASKTAVKVDFTMTVAFVSFSNVYAVDDAGDFIQVYGKNSYKANDVIPAGWEATYELYNGVTPELMPATTLPESTEQKEFTPKEVSASAITTALVNNVILVKNVVLDTDSPATKDNFTGKVGDVELSLRNNYTLASVPAGTYDMTLLVTVYKGAPSLYVISYNNDGSGVAEVEAEAAGEAVYYNLQGVKVAEPENGLYIKVQGNKATKVLVRK